MVSKHDYNIDIWETFEPLPCQWHTFCIQTIFQVHDSSLGKDQWEEQFIPLTKKYYGSPIMLWAPVL